MQVCVNYFTLARATHYIHRNGQYRVQASSNVVNVDTSGLCRCRQWHSHTYRQKKSMKVVILKQNTEGTQRAPKGHQQQRIHSLDARQSWRRANAAGLSTTESCIAAKKATSSGTGGEGITCAADACPNNPYGDPYVHSPSRCLKIWHAGWMSSRTALTSPIASPSF